MKVLKTFSTKLVKIYSTVDEAVRELIHCRTTDCYVCDFSIYNNGVALDCRTYIEQNPEKIAQSLGLKIIREEGD